ncbi:MAG TPA: MATE family efflux transporter [Firmicutes bacterium]|nr:MATE family efflux transporter [Bacillota bacterium]
MEQTNRLGTWGVGKLLLKLSVPAVTAQLVNMLYNIVDRIYIGNMEGIGDAALTGVGVTFPVLMFISAFASLIGMGGAPRASVKLGEKNNAEAERIMGNCMAALLVLAVILTAAFLALGEPLLYLFGASDETIGYALTYMNIYVCGNIFVLPALGMNPFISAQGFARTGMLTVLIGAVVNIVLDPIFIYVFHWGVAGAAIATVISQAVSAVWALAFLSGKKTTLRLKKCHIRLNFKVLWPVLALGVSPFVMNATESLISICFNSSLQKYGGDDAVGAMTILVSIMQLLSLPLSGLAQGAQPITSYNYGCGKMDRVKKSFYLLFIVSMIYSLIFWLINMLFPQLLVGLFCKDGSLKSLAAGAARVYLAAGFVMGAQRACQQTFISLEQAGCSLFLAILRKIILLIPFIYILPALFPGHEVYAVFAAEPVADVLAVSCTVAYFFATFNKRLKKREQLLKEGGVTN